MKLTLKLGGIFVLFFSLFSNALLAADLDTVTTEQYFVVVYGSQDGRNSIPGSHTFASFIKAPRGSNLKTGEGLEFNDISWLPADFAKRLRVDLRLSSERGKNYSVKETLDFVKKKNELFQKRGILDEFSKTSVKSFGAFPISKKDFETGLGRINELNSGQIFYKVDDTRARARSGEGKSSVVNCIHAVSDAFGKPFTGFAHGNAASELVLRFMNESKVLDFNVDSKNVALSSYLDKMVQKSTNTTDSTAIPHGALGRPMDGVHR